ncbi:metallophosphoesterase [Chitinophaga sp. GCM10012297]|uniref:Metallophosphoesterase family protein n=1 Tax=Chitinophaga chungangae TaxID=2821488 RepID=A0ABS3YJM4_9BACT|nr:FN3 domain-containing metallophosphoesterase family protein [Chitinophaga chungangae]MBO9154630.1 metallophosphoesterase family protein [Chitinophaga chungangae]
MQQDKPSLDRRGFLGNLTKAGILGAIGLTPAARLAAAATEEEALAVEKAFTEGEHTFLCPPYLQSPEPTGMTVMWMSNRPTYSWVEYGETAALGKTVHNVQGGIVDSYDRLHRIRLGNLKPGTTYHYKVFSKEITEFRPYKLTYGETISSGTFTFTTPAKNPKEVSWLVFNDIHDRGALSFPHLMALNKDPYDFVFLNGDMFDYQEDEQQILDHLLTPLGKTFASEKPFLFTRGNHETRGKYRRELASYFDGPYIFTKQWGPVHFTVLDTGEDKEDTHPVYAGIVDFDEYRRQQAEDLKQIVQSPAFKKAKFRVVMMHIPHYYSGDWHGTMECRKLFAPVFEQAKVDLFIAGHTHRPGIHQPVAGQHSYPIVIGGGPKDGNRTIIKVKATEKDLNLVMIKDDGSELGRVDLKSKRG